MRISDRSAPQSRPCSGRVLGHWASWGHFLGDLIGALSLFVVLWFALLAVGGAV